MGTTILNIIDRTLSERLFEISKRQFLRCSFLRKQGRIKAQPAFGTGPHAMRKLRVSDIHCLKFTLSAAEHCRPP
ncbi:hypothetical protein DPMN_006218 [Dreissena polymorpha]|uniref:Uncharacterized protein n=1 Tax=Dreissena polymorpha TaxID=45954 RepID=A0A9D4RV72_DREPO|nr:hypothetical protein DPMN_006218 [Dreissena polymorpha]